MSKMTKVIAALGVVAGLGVAAMPLSSYAAQTATANVDVYATVDSALSITAEDATVDLGTIGLSTMKTSAPVKVSVATTANAYKLEIQGLNGDDQMHTVDENGFVVTADMAAASDGKLTVATIDAGDLTGTTSSWGYQLEGETAFKAIPKTLEEIVGTDDTTVAEGAAASGSHNVIFGVKIGSTQADGRYKGSVVFTATVGE